MRRPAKRAPSLREKARPKIQRVMKAKARKATRRKMLMRPTTPLTTPERSLPVSPEPPEEEVVSLSLEDGAGAGPVVEGKAPPMPSVVAKPETGTSSA